MKIFPGQDQEYNFRKLNQVITTSDGSNTIFVPELNEHFHSIHGAVQESEFIFIRNGFETCKADPLNIFEVGFGTGLNALLTAVRCIEDKRVVNYTAIEKYPLPEDVINLLNYNQFSGKKGIDIFKLIHSASWNKYEPVHDRFNIRKIEADLTSVTLSGCYDLIYFDAFGPDKQPEMWSADIFEAIRSVTVRNGILVTYSAKGDVRRKLKTCGFDVTLLPGPPGKRHIIRAVKI